MNTEFTLNDEFGSVVTLRFDNGKIHALVDDDHGVVPDDELHALSHWLQEYGYGVE
jgi:hypothetical protein